MPILSLLPLALAAAPLPEPRAAWVGRSTLAADAEGRWIPFDLTPGNQIRFTMAVDGRPVTAILDTGVSYSVLARRFAEAYRLPVRAEGRATVIGGSVAIGRVETRTVAIGAVTRRGGSLAVADLPAAATGSALAVDMLVGRDLTAPYALDIDYQARRFRLLRSGSRPFAGTSAPLSIAPDRMVYVSAIGAAGATLTPMVVDTGDGSAITLGPAAWATARVAAGPVTTTVSFGLAGAVVSEMAIVPALRIGDAIARDVEVRVEPTGGFSDTIGVAGRIGSGFLQRYRVLLDPAAGQMLLGPTPRSDTPTLRSTSGLLLALTGERLRVLHVMRGGPAAVAGWQEGDTICAVDGTRIGPAYARSALAAWPAGAVGRVVTLEDCTGRRRTLTLKHFY
ncbi:retropepsin-like aspartic protease [Sphingomonas phyllosphaerae]|uniref:retropepsin-like aspartic protease n=1 Tax=Sphingomonas phyllosphaerae TaxID=257003 RepID=UPI00041A4A26|nr:aspartyl protease family protein [Sphingomonas phyllosphaerae]